jgi:site-specific DNA recombinase
MRTDCSNSPAIHKPTRENASEFISRAIENHADEIMTSKTYADYIATRPRAERIGSHGLFTEEGVQVNLAKVSRELNLHDGNVWTAIISLRREDAERLGYNTGERWRQMLRAQSQELSDQLHIPMQDLKWFAAFHNEGHHPHVHLMLKEHNVDVYFEEQGIHSLQPGAEFYITIYGSIAQSESENISANVRWGKAQSAKEGNVPFHYKRFLGYRRGSDGKPEIDPEQAVTVKRIYERFLAGDSLATIASDLNADGIPTPSGVGQWQRGTIESILTNEKYKGDAVLNKTYIRDCLSKKVMINNGERPKYYVENNHPAIIDSGTFGRVQEEMARRSGKRKVKQVGTKTEQGRYSSKYALTELLICGECGTPYRRCTWAANGKKKVVWRCINRLDYGKKYCHDSPSIEESVLQEAIMKAVMQTARQNAEVLKTLKLHIGMGLSAETTEDNSLDLQIRIAEIEAEFQKMLKAIAADNVEAFDEEKAKALMDEKAKLQIQLDRIADTKQKRKNAKSRLDEIFTIIEALANHPISYDDQIVRQILESVIVESKEKIKVVFVGGLEVTQTM